MQHSPHFAASKLALLLFDNQDTLFCDIFYDVNLFALLRDHHLYEENKRKYNSLKIVIYAAITRFMDKNFDRIRKGTLTQGP